MRLACPTGRAARIGLREAVSRGLFLPPPDWVAEDVADHSGHAHDVRHCVLADRLRGRGEGASCEKVPCAQDFLTTREHGEVPERTGTLAGGAACCDARYRNERRPAAAGPRVTAG